MTVPGVTFTDHLAVSSAYLLNQTATTIPALERGVCACKAPVKLAGRTGVFYRFDW